MALEFDYAQLVRAVAGPPSPLLIYEFSIKRFYLPAGEDPFKNFKSDPDKQVEQPEDKGDD